MAAKKKLVKKSATKKTSTKKPAAKKPIVKAKKVALKTKATKVVKKANAVVKKTKKEAKKSLKEVALKQKKIVEKSPKKTAEAKATIKETKSKKGTNLAKQILAKSSEKKEVSEKKIETNTKIVLSKKSEPKSKISFKIGDYAVYPSHGIGKIVEIEKISIHGQDFSCYLMYFEREKLTIKIPVNSVEKIGLRHLVNKSQMDEVFVILRSGIKKLKGMWSRRAQEYETKINSGDIILLAEVLRDLTRDIEDGERSYSERIIYETAVIRLASGYACIYGVSFEEAKDKVIMTAKDKINSEGKVVQHDDFDDVDDFKDSESDSDEEDDEEGDDDEDEEGDDEDDDYFDDDDDDAPKKRRKK